MMDKVGMSGNSDQHYSEDWLSVELDEVLDRFSEGSNPKADQVTCDFPSVRVVEVFYKRINTEKDPQYIIMKMQHYSRKDV